MGDGTVAHRQIGVQRSGVRGLFRHELRDVEKRTGQEVSHSNENIDPARTARNESEVYEDGVGWVPVKSVSQVQARLDARLEGAGGTRIDKKTGATKQIALRKDTAVVRDIVITIDPEWMGTSKAFLEEQSKGDPDGYCAERLRALGVVVDHYGDLYGTENMISKSLHLDEKTPHIHLQVCPRDDQDRIRQNSFIKSGRGSTSDMSMNDRVVRQKLVDAGFTFISLTPTGGSRSHEDTESYKKRNATIEKQIRTELEPEYTRRTAKLDEREGTLDGRADDLDQREAKVAEQERKVAAERRQVAAQRKTLDEDQERWEAGLQERSSALTALDNDIDQFRTELDGVDTTEVARQAVEESVRAAPAPIIDAMRYKTKDGRTLLQKIEDRAVSQVEAKGQDKAAAFSETWGQKSDALKKKLGNLTLGQRRQAKVREQLQARKQNRDQGFSL